MRSHRFPLLLITALWLALTGSGNSASPVEQAPGAPAPAPRALHPDLQSIVDAQRAELARLRAAFNAAPDEVSALAIQRRVARLKGQTEIDLLEVQARLARENGRVAEASQMEAIVRQLQERLDTRLRPASPRAPAATGSR